MIFKPMIDPEIQREFDSAFSKMMEKHRVASIPHLLDVIGATLAATSRNVFNVQADILSCNRKRAELIAEARGILEGRDAVDPLGGAHFVSGEYNRLREILDELERLP